jgi:iron complex transport system substrate-binding protein
VHAGAVAVHDLPAVTGLNTPTPLSIPYSLERIRPALDAAA